MKNLKQPILPHPNQYIAMDQNMEVFAGYLDGYPYWSADFDDFKYVNNTTHLTTLKSWFPNKQIELIKP
jgi:hypothetical protein